MCIYIGVYRSDYARDVGLPDGYINPATLGVFSTRGRGEGI